MLSIILPSFREPEIHDFVEQVSGEFVDCEILVSNDRNGRGKGWAIREALSHAKGEMVVFLDGDGDIQPRMLFRLLPFLDDFDAVVGSKRIAHKHWSRRILTYLSRLYIRMLFGLPFDTQTGIKIFRRDILTDWKSDGFLFDVEILFNIKRFGGRIIEVPIEAEIKERMSGRAVWKTFIESLTLRYQLCANLRVKRKQASVLIEILRKRNKISNVTGKKEYTALKKIRVLNKKGVDAQNYDA